MDGRRWRHARLRRRRWVGRVQRIHVRRQEEVVRAHQRRDQRRERVVVADCVTTRQGLGLVLTASDAADSARGPQRRPRGVCVCVCPLPLTAKLVDGDGIVLVDDWDDPERQQALERRLRVEVATAAAEAVGRQQHLRDGLRERIEE
eukprot:115580-Prymnesium_polylepis.1